MANAGIAIAAIIAAITATRRGLASRRLARGLVASIYRESEKGCSRQLVYSLANRYALRPGLRVVAHPNRRGEQHNT